MSAAEPQFATIDQLFGHDPADAVVVDVPLPGGRLVRVRGLTRFELLNNAKGADGDGALIERRNLASCLVEPRLTLEQAERWQRTAVAGDLVDVVGAMRRLSGLEPGAAKSDVSGDGPDRS